MKPKVFKTSLTILAIMLVAVSALIVAFVHPVSADASVTVAAKDALGVLKQYRTTCAIRIDHVDQGSDVITLTTGTHVVDVEWDLLGYDPVFLPYRRWAAASTTLTVGANTITYVSGSPIVYDPQTTSLTFTLDTIPIGTDNTWITNDILLIVAIVALSLLAWKFIIHKHRR